MKELERAERMKLYFGNGVTTATTLQGAFVLLDSYFSVRRDPAVLRKGS